MCQSIAQGGQRCAAHTRPKFEAATFGTQEWDDAAIAYAATREGERVLTDEMVRAEMVDDIERVVACEHALKHGRSQAVVAAEISDRVGGVPQPQFEVGQRVWWTDPSGDLDDADSDASGYYTVDTDDGMSVLLRDERGDVSNEAFHHELRSA